MRIAHISDCYLPRTGGIETQVRRLTQAELAAGLEPFVISATPANENEISIPGETDNGVPIHRLAVRLPGDLPVTPHIGKRLREVLDGNCDVVHIHGGLISPFAWPALRTANKMELPAVVSVHSMWPQHAITQKLMFPLRSLEHSNVVWSTVSHAAVPAIQGALGHDQQVYVLPNGIDVERWRDTNPVPEYQAGDPVTIVSVARLSHRKRMVPLVEMLAEARRQVPPEIPMRALLIGQGSERGKIERAIERHELDWVELPGLQTQDQIRETYDTASMFVASAVLESFGIAALEARTAGMPVVGFAQSGVSEIVTDGQEGLLASNDHEMAAAIARLTTDHALRAKITRHNRETVPPFSWPDCVAKATELYELAISRT